MHSIYYKVIIFSKNYGVGGSSEINADGVREKLAQPYLLHSPHQSSHSQRQSLGSISPASVQTCSRVSMHVLFPSWTHHLILQALSLTPKDYAKHEEIQAITTLQGCVQNLLKSHDLLIGK